MPGFRQVWIFVIFSSMHKGVSHMSVITLVVNRCSSLSFWHVYNNKATQQHCIYRLPVKRKNKNDIMLAIWKLCMLMTPLPLTFFVELCLNYPLMWANVPLPHDIEMNWASIVLGNGLSTFRRRAIVWTIAEFMFIETWGMNAFPWNWNQNTKLINEFDYAVYEMSVILSREIWG